MKLYNFLKLMIYLRLLIYPQTANIYQLRKLSSKFKKKTNVITISKFYDCPDNCFVAQSSYIFNIPALSLEKSKRRETEPDYSVPGSPFLTFEFHHFLEWKSFP